MLYWVTIKNIHHREVGYLKYLALLTHFQAIVSKFDCFVKQYRHKKVEIIPLTTFQDISAN